MKRQNYAGCLLLATCALVALPVLAQVTNTVPAALPGAPKTVSDYWDLAIGVVSPLIIWAVANIVPKIPKPFLPTLTPVVGIGLGWLVNWLGGQNLGWFEMAKAGALAVFFREVLNQWVTKRLSEPDVPAGPTTPTAPVTPAVKPA